MPEKKLRKIRRPATRTADRELLDAQREHIDMLDVHMTRLARVAESVSAAAHADAQARLAFTQAYTAIGTGITEGLAEVMRHPDTLQTILALVRGQTASMPAGEAGPIRMFHAMVDPKNPGPGIAAAIQSALERERDGGEDEGDAEWPLSKKLLGASDEFEAACVEWIKSRDENPDGSPREITDHTEQATVDLLRSGGNPMALLMLLSGCKMSVYEEFLQTGNPYLLPDLRPALYLVRAILGAPFDWGPMLNNFLDGETSRMAEIERREAAAKTVAMPKRPNLTPVEEE